MATKKMEKIADQKNGTHDDVKIAVGDDATLIGSFKLGERGDVAVVSVSTYKDKLSLDLRRYYLDAREEEYRPTSRGIRIPAEQVDDLYAILEQQRARIAKALGS